MTDTLSGPAQLALMSHEERPDLNTPYLIATGPMSIEQADTAAIEQGAAELAAVGRAEEFATGQWRLKPA
jgi:hypothetical protein